MLLVHNVWMNVCYLYTMCEWMCGLVHNVWMNVVLCYLYTICEWLCALCVSFEQWVNGCDFVFFFHVTCVQCVNGFTQCVNSCECVFFMLLVYNVWMNVWFCLYTFKKWRGYCCIKNDIDCFWCAGFVILAWQVR